VVDVTGTYRHVLRHRGVAALLAGDAVSKVGDGMAFVAVPLLVLRLPARVDPALALSLVRVAPFLLPVAASLFFGLGRRAFDPRAVLLADAALRGGIYAGLGLLALSGALTLWSLAAGLLAGSVLRLLSGSSRRLVAADLLGEAPGRDGQLALNGLIGTSDSLALYVAGPALGGLLAALTSPAFVLLVNGFSCLGLLAAAAFAVPQAAVPAPEEDERARPGWAVLRHTPVALWLFAVVFLFDLWYGPVEVALPLLVTRTLGADSRALGALWTAFGLGALGGAMLTGHLRRYPQRALLLAIVGGWAACTLALALAPGIAVAGVALAIGGAIYGPFTAVAYTMLQGVLRKEELPPVFALWSGGIAVAAPLGFGLGGPLVAAAGTRRGLIASALATAALVPASVWWLRSVAARTPGAGSRRRSP
jgi:Transmembrane secretion effector